MDLCALVVSGSGWLILLVLLLCFDVRDGHTSRKHFSSTRLRILYFRVALYTFFVFALIISVSYIIHLTLLIVDLRKGSVVCVT
ncbi:hypothetical protein BDQ17DRAFT_1349949 [Cyathus striatus]|nr:hypothetical protein BDQ17DRAFT_1349949 [Cyathus striatus]